MRIHVSMIDPNPFRKTDRYPISRSKVDALKVSIDQTGFWDNILVRKNNDRFQLAYGHHRLMAIKELDLLYVDIPVKDLDDATMLRIMANENMDEWRANPAVVNETVLAAKEFIDGELAKYESWGASNECIRSLAKDEQAWYKLKATGAGQTTILAFLGGNWKQWMIQEALVTLKEIEEKVVDRNAVEAFNSVTSAQAFRQAVQENAIPIDIQEEIAKEIITEEVNKEKNKDKDAKDVSISRDNIKNAVIDKFRDISIDRGFKALDDIKTEGYKEQVLDKIQKSPPDINEVALSMSCKLSEFHVKLLRLWEHKDMLSELNIESIRSHVEEMYNITKE